MFIYECSISEVLKASSLNILRSYYDMFNKQDATALGLGRVV